MNTIFSHQPTLKLYIETKVAQKDFSFLNEVSRRIKDNEFLNTHCFLYLSNILINNNIGHEYDSNIIDIIHHKCVRYGGAREYKDMEFKKLMLTKKIKNPEIKKEFFFQIASRIIESEDISKILGKLHKEQRILDIWNQISQDQEVIKPLLKNYFNQPQMIKAEEITLQAVTIQMEVLALKLQSDSSYAKSQLNQFVKEYTLKAEHLKPLMEFEEENMRTIFFKNKVHKDTFMSILDKTIQDGEKKQSPSLRINKTNFDTAIKYAFLNHTIDSKEDKTRRNKI